MYQLQNIFSSQRALLFHKERGVAIKKNRLKNIFVLSLQIIRLTVGCYAFFIFMAL